MTLNEFWEGIKDMLFYGMIPVGVGIAVAGSAIAIAIIKKKRKRYEHGGYFPSTKNHTVI